ncbi:hypothetical protein B5G06_00675 [Flavonifractor sp. An52]|uniref:SH3 domain-containing protein n=1 Tax=Flavonifractor sp. An52 TaxID=1965642 RepID=UPI000B394608|nr:SH3 domain-containing protein [Flavonifractor sp. An52]OUN86517.1 hypothetical protein B5G06_00675 [Flavonifractor sp. An52]
MKKAIIYGMSLALILSMTACGGSNENAADKSQETSTPEVSQSMESSTPTPEQTTQTAPETTPTPESVSTPARDDTTEQEQLFTDCSETLYATTTVNVRDTYSTSGNKLGSLAKAQEITRTGIGIGDADGWSRVVFQGQEAYVSSDYLSATKPQVSKPSTPTGGSSSGQTSKPSTGGQMRIPTEEELDAINDEGRKAVEAAGQGLSGLLNANNGGNPDAFKDNQSVGNAGINVN